MSIFGFIEQNMELPHVDLAVLCFLEMKQKYFNGLLPDPEDKVFGAFVLGKYPEGKQFRSTRTDINSKIILHK